MLKWSTDTWTIYQVLLLFYFITAKKRNRVVLHLSLWALMVWTSCRATEGLPGPSSPPRGRCCTLWETSGTWCGRSGAASSSWWPSWRRATRCGGLFLSVESSPDGRRRSASDVCLLRNASRTGRGTGRRWRRRTRTGRTKDGRVASADSSWELKTAGRKTASSSLICRSRWVQHTTKY